jgi:short-subunit dehydrogenase
MVNYIISSFDCTNLNNLEKLDDLTSLIEVLDLQLLSSGTGDLNENLDFETENKTNSLNLNVFTEIFDWAFNYFEKQGKGHLVAISSVEGLCGIRIAPA